LREKVPLFALVLLWSVLAFVAQHHGGALPSLEALPLTERIWNVPLAYVSYLGQMFWPLRLAVFYPHPGSTVSVVQALGAGLFLLLITVLVLGPGRRFPYLAVGWLWFVVTLMPVIGLVQVSTQARADRYTYIPLIGLFLLLSWGISDAVRAWRVPRLLVIATTTAILSACAALTWIQVGYWRDDRSLWEHALAVTGPTALAHLNLGVYYCGQGSLEAAEKEFAQAAALEPGYAQAHFNLGKVLHDLGRPEEALAEYRKANALNGTSFGLHYNLGSVLTDLGQRPEAIQEYEEALRLEPNSVEAHINLGLTLLKEGRLTEALAWLKRGQEMGAGDRSRHDSLAQWVRLAETMMALDRRLPAILNGEAEPADTPERLALAQLCESKRRYALAVRFYAAAFAAEPRCAADPRQPHRFHAAYAAILAGTALGEDAGKLDEKERAQLRQQGIDWLQADLATWRSLVDNGPPPAQAAARQALRRWRRDLACVYDAVSLARLPMEERTRWQKLWQEVDVIESGATR
jgi:tetratricopeptide (TPR) repeat protein